MKYTNYEAHCLEQLYRSVAEWVIFAVVILCWIFF